MAYLKGFYILIDTLKTKYSVFVEYQEKFGNINRGIGISYFGESSLFLE
jgi:hypothetical protein